MSLKFCISAAQNSIFTGHLSKLLLHLAWSLQEVLCAAPPANVSVLKATNAVRFSNVFLKYLIEKGSSDQLISCISLCLSEKEAKATGLSKGNQNVVGFLIAAMFFFIGNLDVNPSTYWLHLEVGNLLLVMMSTQLHSSLPFGAKDSHIFFDAAMSQEIGLARLVVRKLLMSYIARLPLPENAAHYMTFSKTNHQGVLQKVGSAAAIVLRLPYYTYTYLLSSNSTSGPSPLAQNSLLLLLILVHYRKCIQVDEVAHEKIDGKGEDAVAVLNDLERLILNPFSQALDSARDTDFDLVDLESNARTDSVTRIPFAALYDTLGLSLRDESSVLLLYSLVHGNPAFLEYVLVRTDIDTLLMPLMEMLYDAPRKTPKQIYMLLIILLILSQDASFNASVHKLILPAVSWYKERLLNQASLGSLMVVILIRTVKYNLSKLRDVYLHTNCLAILSNMAPHAHRLNAYAAQRLVSLFDMLSRKYMKLADSHAKSADTRLSMESMAESGDDVITERINDISFRLKLPDTWKIHNAFHVSLLKPFKGDVPDDGEPDEQPEVEENEEILVLEQILAHKDTKNKGKVRRRFLVKFKNYTALDAKWMEEEDLADTPQIPTDLHVYTDFLRIVLEIINAILTYALPRNPEVVYALLHQQELFQPFRNHPRFYELIENIYTVLDFFNARMDSHSNDEEWSVEKVLQVVIANTRSWRGEGLKMFTQLRFTYEEELHPEDFFVPYVWQLAVSNSGISWNLDTITLFSCRIAPELERLESFSEKALDVPATPVAEL
ncbi:hypothetical protein L7F22_054356 [Adiantum nelumboides]|nr:hypothetical protein [Adiantum nelumboides]